MQTSDENNNKKCQLGNYWLIKYQILYTNIIQIVWQTVKRIGNKILGLKRLKNQKGPMNFSGV